MKLSMSVESLKEYLARQLYFYFPDKYKMEGKDIDIAFDLALERLENCFKYISVSSYCDECGQTFFSHLHGDQYAQFLYYFSNSLWNLSQNKVICDKIIYLNRTLNNFFFSYKGKLPDIFFLGHPIGTILGNACYNDFLVVFQNVTINTSADICGRAAPVIGKGVFLATGAKIIGNKSIGDRVSVGVDATVYNTEVPNDKIVIRDAHGEIVIKNRKKENCMAQNYFNVTI